MSRGKITEKNKKQKPDYFIFEKYLLNKKDCSISFFYCLDFDKKNKINKKPITLITQINFNDQGIPWKKINTALLNNILFNLHLALGVDYYKTYCPRKIIIKSGILSQKAAAHWDKLYTRGLGEFFYRNKLDFRGLINFPYQKSKTNYPIGVKLNNRSLLPWGGGKDSCVSAELLKELGHKFTLVSFGNSKNSIQLATAKVSQQEIIGVKKVIDLNYLILIDKMLIMDISPFQLSMPG